MTEQSILAIDQEKPDAEEQSKDEWEPGENDI